MKWTMSLTADRVQFNLEAETKVELELVKLLADYNGTAQVHKGVKTLTTQGGYLRETTSPELVAITITKHQEGQEG